MPPTEEDLAWFRSTFHAIPKAELPDDCVDYSLYIRNPNLDSTKDSEIRLRLRECQKYASDLQKQWLKDYIWQRQGFSLELAKEDGVSLLRGRTEYGDSIEDEWVIVWLLREISKKFNDIWIKMKDNDGEFLLIEASGTIPAWLEPDIAENRVWIHNGDLVIIKPADAARSSKRTSETLSLEEARKILLTEPKRQMRSSIVEAEAFYRIREYPAKIRQNMHHVLMTLPRKIAYLLRQKPAYIAPATEAFYLRDPIALKPLQSSKANNDLTFPPSDLVTVSVRLPRIGYAQVKSQDFPPPGIWKSTLKCETDQKATARNELGLKVSCGFEMLLSDPHQQDKPVVREMKMLLEDLDTGDEKLPTDEEIQAWDMQEDNEAWLDVGFDDLDAELGGKQKGAPGTKKAGFGDKSMQENLQRIVKQFESFLGDDRAGVDGAGMFNEDSEDDLDDTDDSDDEMESDSGEDKEASFNEDEFTAMMREMMGMPPGVMDELMKGRMASAKAKEGKEGPKIGPSTSTQKSRVQKVEDSSDSEVGEEDLQTLMEQMEAELKQNGALNLNPLVTKTGPMRRTVKGQKKDDEPSDDSDDGEENDIDINLAKNLLESFKSQVGMAGPGGNMMGMMGFSLPRDEGDRGQGGSGSGQGKDK